MNHNWPTKSKDMQIAQLIMEEYAKNHESDSIGLLEVIVDKDKKRMDFRIANWVVALAGHFKKMYGALQGDFVTRQVISKCMTQGQTVH